ncbi:MAG: DUF5615 family PIN-like protein [Defluviitaleaceae bacterium]|nr:DUF5615 family PIN-like protein [Defluviitaleaceae bacterium]
MKILVDMNLSPMLATLLNHKGIESKHWYYVGIPNAKDAEIMDYARREGYAVLTCDLGFSAMLSATQGRKPSIVQIRNQGMSVKELAELIVSAIFQNADELEKGAILTVDSKQARVRLLPLFKI